MIEVDLTNHRSGKLTVVGLSHTKNRRRYWQCICDCGNTTVGETHKLKKLIKVSCGCLMGKMSKHGMTSTTEYVIWAGMKRRCYDVNCKSYPRYGARGITICDRWLNSFENFLEDMGRRPSSDYSIDRIDSSKGYFPDNCRWADVYTQAKNKVRTTKVSLNGKEYTFRELAEFTGVKQTTLAYRHRNGLPLLKSHEAGELVKED